MKSKSGTKRKRKKGGGAAVAGTAAEGADHQQQHDAGGGDERRRWKRVEVGLPEPAPYASNHYDDGDGGGDGGSSRRNTQSNDNKKAAGSRHRISSNTAVGGGGGDLEGLPGEEMGFFFGLEVIPAEAYSVEKVGEDGTKRFKLLAPAAAPPAPASATGEEQGEEPGSKTSSNEGEEEQAAPKKEESARKRAEKKKGKRKKKKSEEEEEAENVGSGDVAAAGGEPETRGDDADRKDPEQQKQQHETKALPRNAGGGETSGDGDAGTSEGGKKKKKRKKKKKKGIDPDETKDQADTVRVPEEEEGSGDENASNEGSDGDGGGDDDSAAIESVRNSWMSATGGVVLPDGLCRSLAAQDFWTPTPIQSATLAAAILGRRNVVGAAPTGSGKTLAFLLPICQHLLEESSGDNDDGRRLPLQAIILTPTRELALQIHSECEKLLPGSIGTIVGGLAHAKQERVLHKKRPPILVGTPGRLWEMISKREQPHLNDLSQIRYLVVDEADRMIRQGAFPQLSRILDAVQSANPMDDSDDEEEFSEEDEDEPDRLLGLPGIPGEARVEMLSDEILQRVQQQRQGGKDPAGSAEDPLVREIEDEDYDDLQKELEEAPETGYDEDEVSLPALPPVVRRTYVYSATLTLPASDSYRKSKKLHIRRQKVDVDGAIAELLEKSHAKGRTKVVDLTNASGGKKGAAAGDRKGNTDAAPATSKEFRLPPGLELKQIKCSLKHKDSHLYAYLMTTEEGASGPCLVFCNSIAAVRRVGATLQALGLEVRILHAHMQQRSRFKAVESLKDSKSRKVVVSTDVAARGLDIPSVSSVVHYDVARTVDTFVHRSGRTARGIGAGAVGSSLSLISPGEDKNHARIVDALKVRLEPLHLDGRLLNSSKERVNLACKVVAIDEEARKKQRNRQWFEEKAKEAGLDVEDDEQLLEDIGSAGDDDDPRSRGRLKEAENARVRLRVLLSEPMQTQRYGKFLSTNSAYTQKNAVAQPIIPKSQQGLRKRRKRKRR